MSDRRLAQGQQPANRVDPDAEGIPKEEDPVAAVLVSREDLASLLNTYARPPIDVYAELEGGNWEKWYSVYCDLWELFVNRDAEAVQAESEVELLRASVPSSPHETGLTAEQKARIEGIVDGVLVSFEQGKVAGRRLGEGRLSPSAEKGPE